MQHLTLLEGAGLVIAKREGRVRNYLNMVPVQEIYDRWISRYARPSVELLARLKRDL
jgi:DNA-binding transcriptional ArsR family regulator